MRRVAHDPRPDWQARVEAVGLVYHTTDDGPYWDESAHYELTAAEVDLLEAATNELAELCLRAVDFVIDNNRFAELAIPDKAADAIRREWERDPPSLYGRFDLAFDGQNVKLLEYNADTPTALLEAAIAQWHWLKDVAPESDQFNSIWEALVTKWSTLRDENGIISQPVYFASADLAEDVMTVTVLREAAEEAGLRTQTLAMEDIGWDAGARRFVDLLGRPIGTIFKLYPWEWMVAEEFGSHALAADSGTDWIEPVWKLVLSNKGLLPILWEMFPGHRLLLPSYFGGSQGMSDYVRKPLLSREGANVSVYQGGKAVLETPGDYGEEGYVFQQFVELPDFDGHRPVVGSWVVDHSSSGIGIRESTGLVTDNLSSFVPHLMT
ncbi:MAG: glutathionylspermidine synthase family protein [Armatimonadetes bacterium]|nr:glutathionylspermidine synthase family protein [Armatimonadota bacterium]